MSHIDSFRHEFVGLLAGLPVYHPLEQIDGDFQADAAQLVIGGGSGEHPALVIRSPAGAVAWFLQRELTELHELAQKHGWTARDEPLLARVKSWRPKLQPWLPKRAADLIDWAEWGQAERAAMTAASRSPLLPNPRPGRMGLPEWLVLGIGELVFCALPELAADLLATLPGWRETKLLHMRYNNVLAIPPGLPVYANGGNAFVQGRREA